MPAATVVQIAARMSAVHAVTTGAAVLLPALILVLATVPLANAASPQPLSPLNATTAGFTYSSGVTASVSPGSDYYFVMRPANEEC